MTPLLRRHHGRRWAPLRAGVIGAIAAAVAWAVWLAWDRHRLANDPEAALLEGPAPDEAFSLRARDGVSLHVEVFGAHNPSTIVLVHGWTQALRFWTYQVRDLSRDHRVVAFDLRGHGLSGRGRDYSMESLADDIECVLEGTVPRGERATLVGHSLGAMSIVAWAGRHPSSVSGRVSAVVLFNTGLGDLAAQSRVLPAALRTGRGYERFSGVFLGSRAPLPRLRTPLSAAAVRYVALSRGASRAQVAFCERMVMECDPSVRAGFGMTMSTLDLHHMLQHLTVPTTVVSADHDRLTPPWHADRLAADLPHLAERVALSDSGHMGPIEASDEAIRAIRDAVRTVG